jgi:hypothetical protein
MGISETHWPSDPSEIKCRCHAYIAHEQETLAKLLSELGSEIDTSPENIIVEKLKRCFKCIDDMMEYASQFLSQALFVEMRTFTGFYYEMNEDASQSIRQTLTIISKLREKKLFLLVPQVKDLVIDLDDVKTLVSRRTLEQVRETLERYYTRRAYTCRKIENF